MMIRIVLSGILLNFCILVSAQDSLKNHLINSGEIINRGIELHDREQYDSAVAQYDLVDRNDTNYTLAQYEKSLSLHGKKNYARSISILHEILKDSSNRKLEYLMNLGTVLDDSGAYDESGRMYLKALKIYPYHNVLQFNYALNLRNQKNDNEAIRRFQMSVKYNPYHASSYLQMANVYYSQGRKIPAMLAYGMFIIFEPASQRAYFANKQLKKIVDGSIDQDKDVKPVRYDEDRLFLPIQEILESKAANDKRYKTGVDINDILVRQMHVVLSNLSYNKADTGFLSRYIISYMKGMFDDGYYEPYCYYMFTSYNNEMINKWLKKKQKTVDVFKKWSADFINKSHEFKDMNINGTIVNARCYYYDNGRIHSFGKIKTDNGVDIKQGLWTYISSTGSVETEAYYNQKGEEDGACTVWYPDGRLMKKYTNSNGKEEGAFIQYFENGEPKYRAMYKNGKLVDTLFKYYNHGGLRSAEAIDNDSLQGISRYYKRNGELSAILKNIDNKTDSLAVYYFPNGKIQSTAWFKNNQKNGQAVFYYDNGVIEAKGEFKDNQYVGKWLNYWDNGTVKSEYSYTQDGKLNGVAKEFSEKGILTEENNYINGKLNGKSSVTNEDDGKPWYTIDYKNGVIKKITNYTSTGAVCTEFEDKGKRLPITFMTPRCKKRYEGMFYDSERDGHWTYYFSNGSVSSEENYKRGSKQGLSVDYLKNGQIESKVNFSDNERNGYYTEYFRNGMLCKEGWYSDGQKQGYWNEYNLAGNKIRSQYYLNGDLTGYQTYYQEDGKLDFEMLIRDGMVEKYLYYDTLGNMIRENVVVNGKAHCVAYFCDGVKRLEGEISYGNFNGPFKRFYHNGKRFEESFYVAGFMDGTQKQYFSNGKLMKVAEYKAGDNHGKCVWYHDNGKVEVDGQYKNDQKDGTWQWFDAKGRMELVRNYRSGKFHGEHIWYDSTSTVMLKLIYDNDDLQSYSYLDKNKNFVQPVNFENETGNVKTTYPNGSVAAEMEYKKGWLYGNVKFYYQSGKLMETIPYQHNKVQGTDIAYYENGNKRYEETFLLGVKHGQAVYYRPDGTKEHTEQWYMDEKHGLFEYFDAKGNILKKEKYVYNELFE